MIITAYFKTMESALRMLLWDGGPAHIAINKLMRGWYDGGIALPDIRKYYWAVELTTINQGVHLLADEPSFSMNRLGLQPEGYLQDLKAEATTHDTPGTHDCHCYNLAHYSCSPVMEG